MWHSGLPKHREAPTAKVRWHGQELPGNLQFRQEHRHDPNPGIRDPKLWGPLHAPCWRLLETVEESEDEVSSTMQGTIRQRWLRAIIEIVKPAHRQRHLRLAIAPEAPELESVDVKKSAHDTCRSSLAMAIGVDSIPCRWGQPMIIDID